MATTYFNDHVRFAKLSLMRRRIAQMAADRQRQQTVHPLAALFQILEPTEPPPQAPIVRAGELVAMRRFAIKR